MKYCIANNYGRGFFTNEDRKNFHLGGHPGNLWVVEDNEFGNAWIKRVNGVELTKEEGEAMLNEILKPREEKLEDFLPYCQLME